MTVYVDADHAHDLVIRRLNTGELVMVNKYQSNGCLVVSRIVTEMIIF
jgi:hypothetical protein